MSHLQRSGVTGHLLCVAGGLHRGRLANECLAAGPHPLCSDCNSSAPLTETFTVSISGFPAVCYVDTFNGAWTVTHQSDCVWYYDITAFHRVTLYFASSAWRVAWAVDGGAGGSFVGSGGSSCDPASMSWSHATCFEPPFCWTLCSTVQSAGVVIVS
jgi:hypothetical protein